MQYGTPSLLVGDVLRAAAARHPNRVAVAMGERERTFQQIAEESQHLAALLISHGVGRGARLAWWADTCLEAIPLYFACAHVGAMFVPLNPRYTDAEGRAVLDFAEPALVLTDKGRCGHETLDRFRNSRADPVTLPFIDEKDPLAMFFTSGTTGQPKGCVLSHRTERLRAGPGSPWPVGPTICTFPQFHMAGWAYLLGTWLSGDRMVLVPRADAESLIDAVQRHRASFMYCIPAVWRRILDADRSRCDLSSLRRADTGTSATSEELLRGIRAAFPHATTSVVYGSTEASMGCTLGPEDIFRKPGSIGPPAPGVQARVDASGEFWLRTPLLFSGYFRDESATRATIVDGWYRTGETARCDEDGYYYLTGRVKDLIRTGGETVAPAEIDAVLQTHPSLADAAVAGMPDDQWGQVLTAFVVLRPGHAIDLAELRRFCQERLAPHKYPRRLVVVEAIPRTGATGQVQRGNLLQSIGQVSDHRLPT